MIRWSDHVRFPANVEANYVTVSEEAHRWKRLLDDSKYAAAGGWLKPTADCKANSGIGKGAEPGGRPRSSALTDTGCRSAQGETSRGPADRRVRSRPQLLTFTLRL